MKLVIETSRPIAKVAKELGINAGTLANWVTAYRRAQSAEESEPDLTVGERARLKEQEREIRELRMEIEFLKKGVPRTLMSLPG